KAVTGLFLGAVAPQQAQYLVPRLRLALGEGQVGEQGLSLLRGDVDDRPVGDPRLKTTEKPELEPGHRRSRLASRLLDGAPGAAGGLFTDNKCFVRAHQAGLSWGPQ